MREFRIKTERLTTDFLESAPAPLAVFDRTGKIAFWNQAAVDLFGFSRDEMIGASAPDDFSEITHGIERTIRCKDGSHVCASITTAPLGDQVIAVFTDVSRFKEAESERKALYAQLMRQTREVADAHEKLKDLDRLKSDFLSMVSHELKTPLTTLQAIAENFMESDLPEKKRRFLEIMHRNILRLERLVRNLIDRSRLEAGQFPLRKEPHDIAVVVRETVDHFAALAKKGGVSVRVDMPDALLIVADLDAVTQIISNLLDNAVRFAQESVVVRIEREGRFAVISVENDGPTLTDQERQAIFDRFSKVRAEGKSQLGLGLSIVRDLARAHGGSAVVVAGNPGLRFEVRVPVE